MSIVWGYFMQGGHPCVLIHIRTRGVVGAVTGLDPPVKLFLLAVPGRCFFVDHFCYLCFVFAVTSFQFIQPCSHLLGKG